MKAIALLLSAAAMLAVPAFAANARPNISCPGDQVVWLNTRSGIYHYQGETWFGHTKHGRFECERQAKAEGDRATENGQ